MDKSILKGIADNPALFDALKAHIEKYFDLDEVVTTMSDEKMGQVVRARVSGLEKIEKAFRDIERLKTVKERPEQLNPAR